MGFGAFVLAGSGMIAAELKFATGANKGEKVKLPAGLKVALCAHVEVHERQKKKNDLAWAPTALRATALRATALRATAAPIRTSASICVAAPFCPAGLRAAPTASIFCASSTPPFPTSILLSASAEPRAEFSLLRPCSGASPAPGPVWTQLRPVPSAASSPAPRGQR